MKNRFLTKRLVAIIMAVAMIVTGSGFSPTVMREADQPSGSAVSKESKESNAGTNDRTKNGQSENDQAAADKTVVSDGHTSSHCKWTTESDAIEKA